MNSSVSNVVLNAWLSLPHSGSSSPVPDHPSASWDTGHRGVRSHLAHAAAGHRPLSDRLHQDPETCLQQRGEETQVRTGDRKEGNAVSKKNKETCPGGEGNKGGRDQAKERRSGLILQEMKESIGTSEHPAAGKSLWLTGSCGGDKERETRDNKHEIEHKGRRKVVERNEWIGLLLLDCICLSQLLSLKIRPDRSIFITERVSTHLCQHKRPAHWI